MSEASERIPVRRQIKEMSLSDRLDFPLQRFNSIKATVYGLNMESQDRKWSTHTIREKNVLRVVRLV